MIGLLRRLLGPDGDPTETLKRQLAEGKEGVDWVATPTSAPVDLAELTDDERARVTFADEDTYLAHANTWGPAGFRKGGPIPQSADLTFTVYDPETATLTVDVAGTPHTLTAYWVASLQPNRHFTGKQEVEWATALTPSRGVGMRPAMMARAYGDANNHPSLPRDARMADEKSPLALCYCAGSFLGLDDVLALKVTPDTTHYFVIDSADLREVCQ